MNKSVVVLALLLAAAAAIPTACGTEDDPVIGNSVAPAPNPEAPEDGDDSDGGGDSENEEGENEMKGKITIRAGERSFAAALDDNAAARAFAALLPMTVTMAELNGNEKYCYLPENLPAESCRPGTIRNGDLMLYGSSCIVLFYGTFPSSYSYTRIGRLDNPSGLASALGRGSATVTFEINDN